MAVVKGKVGKHIKVLKRKQSVFWVLEKRRVRRERGLCQVSGSLHGKVWSVFYMNLMSFYYSYLSSNSSRKYLIHLLSFQNTVAFVKPIRLLFSWQRLIFLFQAPIPKKWILSRYLVANIVRSIVRSYVLSLLCPRGRCCSSCEW